MLNWNSVSINSPNQQYERTKALQRHQRKLLELRKKSNKRDKERIKFYREENQDINNRIKMNKIKTQFFIQNEKDIEYERSNRDLLLKMAKINTRKLNKATENVYLPTSLNYNKRKMGIESVNSENVIIANRLISLSPSVVNVRSLAKDFEKSREIKKLRLQPNINSLTNLHAKMERHFLPQISRKCANSSDSSKPNQKTTSSSVKNKRTTKTTETKNYASISNETRARIENESESESMSRGGSINETKTETETETKSKNEPVEEVPPNSVKTPKKIKKQEKTRKSKKIIKEEKNNEEEKVTKIDTKTDGVNNESYGDELEEEVPNADNSEKIKQRAIVIKKQEKIENNGEKNIKENKVERETTKGSKIDKESAKEDKNVERIIAKPTNTENPNPNLQKEDTEKISNDDEYNDSAADNYEDDEYNDSAADNYEDDEDFV